MPKMIDLPGLDLLVVGAGPAGLGVAIAAARAGLGYEVVEKGAPRELDLPLPQGHDLLHHARAPRVGNLPFVTPCNAKPTREEALQYYRRVAETHHLALSLGERVESVGREGERLHSDDRRGAPGDPSPVRSARRARSVVVATGTYDQPNVLGIPGEDLPHVAHYFDEPHAHHRRRVVVVGGVTPPRRRHLPSSAPAPS